MNVLDVGVFKQIGMKINEIVRIDYPYLTTGPLRRDENR